MYPEYLDLLASYEDLPYPEDFLAAYVVMECLSDRNGVTTFLVENRAGERFVAKCFDKTLGFQLGGDAIRRKLSHEGLPRYVASFENERMLVTVREYVEGVSLERYAAENELSEQEIVRLCIGLCDILAFLHHRDEPIIHRDVKPENIIVRPDAEGCALIDFDIARVYRSGNESDTTFFGTVAYAPPEQYGFSQTDVRADIYALGVLLRWLLTGQHTGEQKRPGLPPAGKNHRQMHGLLPRGAVFGYFSGEKGAGTGKPARADPAPYVRCTVCPARLRAAVFRGAGGLQSRHLVAV